jgi:hypothetical protein
MKPMTEAVEDSPSDAPKKKDSKLSKEFQGKLSHASPQIKPPLITNFFTPREFAVSAPDSKVDVTAASGKETSDSPAPRASVRKKCDGPTDSSKCDGESHL